MVPVAIVEAVVNRPYSEEADLDLRRVLRLNSSLESLTQHAVYDLFAFLLVLALQEQVRFQKNVGSVLAEFLNADSFLLHF